MIKLSFLTLYIDFEFDRHTCSTRSLCRECFNANNRQDKLHFDIEVRNFS
jgi:hypothetical protein